MTVIGSLEDLSFPDILQVVHVSRQTGTLLLAGPSGQRRVRFRGGLVCGATLGTHGPELEEVLLQRGLVSAAALRNARERSARLGEPLLSALVGMGAVAQATLENLVRDELRALLRSLVLLQEGEFRFEIETEEAPVGSGELGLRDGLAPDNILQGLPKATGPRGARGRRSGDRRSRAGKRPAVLVIERAALRQALQESLARHGNDLDAAMSAVEGAARSPLQEPERTANRVPPRSDDSIRVGDSLSLLRGLIGEMRSEEKGGIPLLVLRLAAEYFERGILFAVNEDQVLGAGAFGGRGEAASAGLDARIRGVALPLQRGSILRKSIEDRQIYVGPIAPIHPNEALLEKLGGPAPREAALLPLLAGRRVYGILYGDNSDSERPVGDLRALEIFLSQAGIALENALLQRRIARLSGGGSRRGSVPHV